MQKATSISRLASCAPSPRACTRPRLVSAAGWAGRVAADYVCDVGGGLGVAGEDEEAHRLRRERCLTEHTDPLDDSVERAGELRDPVPLEFVG